MNPKEAVQKTFTTIDGNTLMAQTFEPLRFSVDKILPHGLFIFAGSPKVGKSWLSLDLSHAIATGGKQWDYSAEQGDVLYLAPEDNYSRLQNRLKKVNADEKDVSRLHMTTSSFGIHDGLLEQIHSFVKEHDGTNLVVVDTLEHIRNGQQETSPYSCDYRDMNRLCEITDKHKLTLLFIHHLRPCTNLGQAIGRCVFLNVVTLLFAFQRICPLCFVADKRVQFLKSRAVNVKRSNIPIVFQHDNVADGKRTRRVVGGLVHVNKKRRKRK